MDTNIAVGSTIKVKLGARNPFPDSPGLETLVVIDKPEAAWPIEGAIYVVEEGYTERNWFYVYPDEIASVEPPKPDLSTIVPGTVVAFKNKYTPEETEYTITDMREDGTYGVEPSGFIFADEIVGIVSQPASVWDTLLEAVKQFGEAAAKPIDPKSEGVSLSFSDVPGVDVTADTQQVNATLLWLAIRYELEVEFDYQKSPGDYVLPRSLDPDKIEGADDGLHALVGGTDPDTGDYRTFRTDRIDGYVRLIG